VSLIAGAQPSLYATPVTATPITTLFSTHKNSFIVDTQPQAVARAKGHNFSMNTGGGSYWAGQAFLGLVARSYLGPPSFEPRGAFNKTFVLLTRYTLKGSKTIFVTVLYTVCTRAFYAATGGAKVPRPNQTNSPDR